MTGFEKTGDLARDSLIDAIEDDLDRWWSDCDQDEDPDRAEEEAPRCL